MRRQPVVVWFRNDLRLRDHPALTAAGTSGAPLVCLYVLDEVADGRPLGGAARWWLAGSLRALDASLAKRGQRLVLRRGACVDMVAALAQECRAEAVYWNRQHTPAGEAADRALGEALARSGIAARPFAGDTLFAPDRLRAAHKPAPRVFAPFWKRLQALGAPHTPLPAPRTLGAPLKITGDDLRDWTLEPARPDWAGGMRAAWTRGEAGANARLHHLIDGGLHGYAERRERADVDGSSRLSPHLRFGEVSPAAVWHGVRFALDAPAGTPARGIDAEKFLAELGWREFSRHQLLAFPHLATRNMRAAFDRFPWRDDDAALRAWQRGETGYPLIDAAMRDLWTSGWMPNRLRMVAASFLVKHLLIDWRRGEQWFWDTLVDADPASNPANWQWVAG
ncbi:MAG: deoxyribodipyrimidine photo-lyase, partial [Variibacter sp.]|nr:deoxyribodipyrimidine photo-lyase [Variibacter sp.]